MGRDPSFSIAQLEPADATGTAGSSELVKSLTVPDTPPSTSLPASMDPRDERPDVSSPHSYTDGQWSPPPQFQEHDQIYAAQGSPQSYHPHPHSPPQVSPPLEYQEEYHHSSQSQVQPYAGGYQQEYVSSLSLSSGVTTIRVPIREPV